MRALWIYFSVFIFLFADRVEVGFDLRDRLVQGIEEEGCGWVRMPAIYVATLPIRWWNKVEVTNIIQW